MASVLSFPTGSRGQAGCGHICEPGSLALLGLFLSANRHKQPVLRTSGGCAGQGTRKPGWGDLRGAGVGEPL